MADAPLSIAQVAPRRRGATSGLNDFVDRVCAELVGRGHEVLRIETGDPVKRLLGKKSARTIDVVHVHEPFAPSISSAALRHSYALNVATFHAPQERVLSTQVARPLVEIFFGRIDARTVTSEATAQLLDRYFPASYELTPPAGEGRDWGAVTDELEALYRR
ncbi:MAG TPA: glycosyltransferase, partial [Solirubrobacterales bacterium]|nr:glycosyltransferase [Solirubrobacterales bacterium]